MSQYDWSRFSQKTKIKAPVQKVYDAWTSRRGIESWFLRLGAFSDANGLKPDDAPVQKGDAYHWRWHGWPDTVEEFGEVIEANGKDKFSFVFGKAGIVTVHLKAIPEGTEMEIVQENIPTDEEGKVNYHVGCSTGWTFYKLNLKSVLEGGIDLRNLNNTTDHND